MSLFFGTERQTCARSIIPATCFLLNYTTVFENFSLTFNFIFNAFDCTAEGVNVLHFGSYAELFLTFRSDGNVNVASERTFLHFTVRNTYIFKYCLKGIKIFSCICAGTHIRLGNDFDKRHTASVIVKKSFAFNRIVNGFAGILFYVNSCHSDSFLFAVNNYINTAVNAKWQVKLRNLVSLGKVRIEIVFSVLLG